MAAAACGVICRCMPGGQGGRMARLHGQQLRAARLDPDVRLSTVCTGLMLRGGRAGRGRLAARPGRLGRPEVDETRLALAGWSHGGWGIMEAMSCGSNPATALGLVDPAIAACRGQGDLSGLSLRRRRGAEPDAAVAALSEDAGRSSRSDHLTTVRNAERVHDMVRNCGAEVRPGSRRAPTVSTSRPPPRR